ncbi:DUF6715 family protein [Butyrivibrio sp. VCB2006]|uniref:DUF6715 family protein n=1 Tax=Butyrivibrio sp. VCB2006 TaxID=1280679 RepID=UPI0004010194|nr:DUF6715 family protein [Butyrivibrio sp. VCB2006]
MEESTKSAIIKSIVLVVLGAIFIGGIFLVVLRSKKASDSENYVLTVVDEITTTNLDKSYPADPKMVVEMYGKIMQTLYKETYTDEQEDRMINVLAGLMDDELMANQTNFHKSIKDEVKQRKENDYSISVYQVQRIDLEAKVDGRNACTVDCYFYLRQGTGGIPIIYQFVLRQDDTRRWKILGWQPKEE